MFRAEYLDGEAGLRLADAHETRAALLTPAWLEAAWLRGFVDLEQPPEGSAQVFKVMEAHLNLTEGGREQLAEIERDWSLVPRPTAVNAFSWTLRSALGSLSAVAAGTIIGVTVAFKNLRNNAMATGLLGALVLILIGVATGVRWRRMQITRRNFYYYWLRLGDRKRFEHFAEEARASGFDELLGDVEAIGEQMDLALRMTDYRLGLMTQEHDDRLREIAAWRESKIRGIKEEGAGN
jgi:hypothetical protein